MSNYRKFMYRNLNVLNMECIDRIDAFNEKQ